MEQMKSKSFEEREEEYQKVRERIFSQDVSDKYQIYLNFTSQSTHHS